VDGVPVWPAMMTVLSADRVFQAGEIVLAEAGKHLPLCEMTSGNTVQNTCSPAGVSFTKKERLSQSLR
jgi:hypothetical protein